MRVSHVTRVYNASTYFLYFELINFLRVTGNRNHVYDKRNKSGAAYVK